MSNRADGRSRILVRGGRGGGTKVEVTAGSEMTSWMYGGEVSPSGVPCVIWLDLLCMPI